VEDSSMETLIEPTNENNIEGGDEEDEDVEFEEV
jgi:hypothetical protein